VIHPRDDAPWAADPPDGGADPERMAALLDGRLRGAERDELLARLADRDDDLALFAEASAIQRALEAEDGAAGVPGVTPLRPASRPARRVNPRWLALAAVLAGVTLLPLAWRASRGGAIREPSQAVALLENPAAGLPAGWDERPWSQTRGGGGPIGPPEARAARVGAYAVDIELAIRAGDVEQRQILAGNAAAVLSAEIGIASKGFQELAASTETDQDVLLSQLEDATNYAAISVDPDMLALGAWAEAARFAAMRQDAGFFRNARTHRTLARAEELVGEQRAAKEALAAVSAAAASDPPNWDALKKAVDDLHRAVT
jgi:hypothetical protein